MNDKDSLPVDSHLKGKIWQIEDWLGEGIRPLQRLFNNLGDPTALTFKGCVLTQISSLNIAIQMDYDLNRRNNQPPEFSYNDPITDIPAEEIPQFVEVLFQSHIMASYNLCFPCLPDIPLSYPELADLPEFAGKEFVGAKSGGVLPEFRAFFASFLEEISNYNENSWKEYYARHSIDLARVYVKTGNLSQDEYERLVHECDYRLYNYLKSNLASSDPLLQALHGKFAVEINNQSLLL